MKSSATGTSRMGNVFKGLVAIGIECADEVKAAAGLGLIPAVPIALAVDVIAAKTSFFTPLTSTAIAFLWLVNVLLAVLILTAVFLPSSTGFAALYKAVYGQDALSSFEQRMMHRLFHSKEE